MVKSDILLDDEGIEMIPADGPVDVNAGPDETPGIRLVPATASLRLGGGTSNEYNDGKTFGNIRLNSKDGDPRIVLSTGEIAPADEEENAVFIFSDGLDESGQIWLGRVGESFGESTVRLDAKNSQITLGGGSENGTLSLRDGAGTTVDLAATDGVARLGQGGGKLRLELDPGNGLFSVVDADGNPVFQVDADGVVTFGSGEGKVGMDLDPESGLFSIVDADGEPVFQIDTQAETVNTAKGYSRGTIDDGAPR